MGSNGGDVRATDISTHSDAGQSVTDHEHPCRFKYYPSGFIACL